MRFRQVHLDFHTSEAVPEIGRDFDADDFRQKLKLGRVDSITVFSKCHHGWAYHPSDANEIHPQLDFDLLGAQIDAAHAIGVKTPVYLSAGLDEKLARRHPEWLIRDREERTNWSAHFMQPGYHQFCMNTPYLDMLAAQVREVVERYDADGIFLDIVGVRECYCQSCVAEIRRRGSDPRRTDAMRKLWEETYQKYGAAMDQAVHALKPGLPLFHNNGHIERGRRDLAALNTHLELESLPTGGWGYDHFPLSVRYAQGLGLDVLGMTGKFHHSWGEFGGFKHPNALRYEAALSLANGAGCSIGDQLHPLGRMDEATYALIGAAYTEVEAKEEWCRGVSPVADIALLSAEAAGSDFGAGAAATADLISGTSVTDGSDGSDAVAADTGAVRLLLEGHYLFDVIDTHSHLDAYKVLVLPDCIAITPELQERLKAFTAAGGKILATGRSGLTPDGQSFALELGAQWQGASPFNPTYACPAFELPSLRPASFVVYANSYEIGLAAGGTSLGSRQNPYFNRDLFTFTSHQHAPSRLIDAGPGFTSGADGLYAAWNLFADYARHGSLPVKQMLLYLLDTLLESASGGRTLSVNLPAQGIVTLQEQPDANRRVLHLLYAPPVRRGQNTEVIEDLPTVPSTDVTLAEPRPVKRLYLAPQRTPLDFAQQNGKIACTVPAWSCHQMVVAEF
ncbi:MULTISPECIES: beta-galactosidase trimerization domain-containing protein [Saccharibacillus]|uniref:beta-galactosidase trimerization domain-containing protein n=1 Tax=Saccharibacillus TaxID=456492 RepID=UPI00123ABAC8|nr:beta-galactosidase trimerization domain-containing protein [Saccharibacillus sp. WB 17]MWJ33031.1 beta-galactosidase [Saccharibacillus sp. WB 17]